MNHHSPTISPSCDSRQQINSSTTSDFSGSPVSAPPGQPYRRHRASTVISPAKSIVTANQARRKSVPTNNSQQLLQNLASLTRGSPRDTLNHPPARALPLGNTGLTRHGTLLTANATPVRAAAELKSILGNNNARLKPKAALIRVDSGSAAFNRHVTLEQAKSRARVKVDILPQGNICVQGGHLRGHIKILVRRATRKETPIFIAGGKIRIIGFETLGDRSRSIFYQCSAMLASVTPSLEGLYASDRDEEGFAQANEGKHEFPFALYLSLSTSNGQARGTLNNQSGFGLHYIAMVSLKIKDEPGRRSISHFYRSIEVWPRLDPTTILSPALRPLQATVAASISKNSSSRRIKLTASLYRLHWVAGQRCTARIMVENDTDKQLRELTVSLHRTTTIFPQCSDTSISVDIDTRKAVVTTKQVAANVLKVGQPPTKGYASARGWWRGFPPQRASEVEHSVLIPLDALTVPRGCFFEVEFSLRVAIVPGMRLTSDLQVTLPIRIVNFISLDPPPSQPLSMSTEPSSPARGTSAKTSNTRFPRKLTVSGSTMTSLRGTRDHLSVERHDIFPEGSHGHFFDESETEESCSDCTDGLGNLSLVDDTDEVVHHAVSTARMDMAYDDFSGLSYVQNEWNTTDSEDSCDSNYARSGDGDTCSEKALETLIKEVAMPTGSNSVHHDFQMKLTRPSLGTRRRSSFPVRVEEKTYRAITAFLNGDQDAHCDQGERKRLSAPVNKGRQTDKPRLRLDVPLVVDKAKLQSSRGPANIQQLYSFSAGRAPARTQEQCNVYEPSLQSGNLGSAMGQNGSPKHLIPASGLVPATVSQQFYSMHTPPFHQDCEDATTLTIVPSYGHHAVNIVDCDTPEEGALLRKLFSDPPITPDTGAKEAITAPTLQVRIDLEKVYRSDTQSISPASATSHASGASVATVSVRDKVRELEERVKTAAST